MLRIKVESLRKKNCLSCAVREQSLFAELRPEDFDLIDQPVLDLSADTDTRIYEEGATGAHVYMLRHGLVKLVRVDPEGSQRILRLLMAGDVLGLESLVIGTYESTAIALSPVSACRIPVPVIHRLEAASPRLHTQMLRKWHEAMQRATAFITDLGSGTARERVARLVLHLAEASASRVVLLPTREDIGAMLGITTETASRTTAAFGREGLLRRLDRSGDFEADLERLAVIADRKLSPNVDGSVARAA